MPRPRHRICMCFTDDGNTRGLGKPLKCFKTKEHAEKFKTKDTIVEKCIIPCGINTHWHLYSVSFITENKLWDKIDQLGGVEKTLGVLNNGS